LPPGADFTTNGEFERRHGYRVQSMMVVPMIDHLITCWACGAHQSKVGSHGDDQDERGRRAVRRAVLDAKSGCAIAREPGGRLDRERDCTRRSSAFWRASSLVTAIEQRDPTTVGHSIRVAVLTTRLARALERAGSGRYRDVRFTATEMRELRFAALLHDFGKLSVREDVLIKAKKLPPVLTERVSARFDLIRRTLEMSYCEQRSAPGRDGAGGLDVALEKRIAELERQRQLVCAANEPTVLDRAASDELLRVARCTFRGPNNVEVPYLTADELHYLQIVHGTLDAGERAEIESHVSETYQFPAHPVDPDSRTSPACTSTTRSWTGRVTRAVEGRRHSPGTLIATADISTR
jgi:hypothetical protein